MTTTKNKINWYYIVVGFILIFLYFNYNKNPVQENDLTQKKVTLYRDIQFLGGRRSRSHYRLWTNEAKAAFIIKPAGYVRIQKDLDNLKTGDTVFLKYNNSREQDVENKAKEILIYSLQKADKVYFDLKSYNEADLLSTNRASWIVLPFAIILILRGLTIINSKMAFITGGLVGLTIIVLRILNKF